MVETIRLICRLFSLPLTEAKELVHVARFGAAEYQAHIGAVVTALEDVGKVLDHEAQIGRQLTEDEAEAFLNGIAAKS
ncbi:hypothetical protein MF271_04765 [Deinococcus sp. KNUC1210]|uniref:hypothetical protein n=1 Tax=Deinococcus sp. KNUC1210 TaxID=2917691 RepID=UPI001EEFA6F4|nr:hypothetical protein [Deinococcus sp. KNUC1210]ULH15946.1 hypothetical protein MF271_04765 [Deinococcus sp. KNUC1210]